MRGNASTINTHGGSGGGGGGGGGSYGASDGTPGVNSGNGKARVTTYRAP
jgi:hypothetical protein